MVRISPIYWRRRAKGEGFSQGARGWLMFVGSKLTRLSTDYAVNRTESNHEYIRFERNVSSYITLMDLNASHREAFGSLKPRFRAESRSSSE
jgi:hypothetical protein